MYLETTTFLAHALHIISIIALPIHFLGAYCILFRTPKTMKSMKWTLFILHVWCMVQDWTLTILIIPVFNFPTVSGYGMGLLSLWDVPQIYQFYLLMTQIIVMCVAIALIFENRYYQLFAKHGPWKYFRIPFIFLNYFIAFTYFLPIGYAVPDQEIEVKNIIKRIPNLSPEIERDKIFVLSNNFEFALSIFGGVALLTVIESLIFCGLIYINMNSKSKIIISETTLKMQKKILKAILIQITIFLVTIQIPFGYLSFSIISDYYNQFGNNMVFILSGIHGISNTLVMLWAHKPYRESCKEILCCKRRAWQKEQSGNESKVFQKNKTTMTYNLNNL